MCWWRYLQCGVVLGTTIMLEQNIRSLHLLLLWQHKGLDRRCSTIIGSNFWEIELYCSVIISSNLFCFIRWLNTTFPCWGCSLTGVWECITWFVVVDGDFVVVIINWDVCYCIEFFKHIALLSVMLHLSGEGVEVFSDKTINCFIIECRMTWLDMLLQRVDIWCSGVDTSRYFAQKQR